MAVGIPLGPYRLVRRLASGGMAEIFLARQEGKDGFARDLVVKRILPHLAADAEFTHMFRDEAQLAALLSHPNVVHVYDFGSEQDDSGEVLWLAMELVRGVDLRALIVRAAEEARATGREFAIPPHHAAKIVSFVCEALAHAHALRVGGRPAGVVHRDVTPSNVLLSFDGAVKLADFGIAKARTGGAKVREATEVGVVKGKLAYLSPEQARGEPLDARSDLFNAGILLFESVLGEPLFPHHDFRRAKMLSAQGQLPDAHRLARMPPGLARVVERALAPRREDRYPDALSLRAELEAFLRGEREHSDSVEIGRFVRYLFPDALEEDARGARAAGTVQATSAIKFGTQVLVPGATPTGERALPPSAPAPESVRLPPPLSHSEFDDPTELSEPSISMRAAHAPRAHGPIPGPGTAPRPARSRLALAVAIAAAVLTIASAVGVAVLIALPPPGPPETPAMPPAEPPAVPEPIAQPIPMAPRAPAQLRVTSEPAGHALFVDARERGATPAVVTVDPGPHRVEIRDASGAVLADQAIEVGESEIREIAIALPPALERATLRVDSAPPGAIVRVDGEEVGTTPLAREVLPTRHRVDVELEGYVPAGNEVTLARPGEQATLAFALTPAPRATPRRPTPRAASTGTLTIATTPWSEVYLGARHLGTTPLANVRLPVGTHVLTLRSPGRSAQRTTVTIREGEQTRVRLSL